MLIVVLSGFRTGGKNWAFWPGMKLGPSTGPGGQENQTWAQVSLFILLCLFIC